ncbi:MAG: KH domain protein [Candidatus Syntrophoarchaeum sp. GoM_oil]|nr:MAG: KH domain protein [Candidatus Syntrophoarchaeum sp. GoM_oil]
MIEHIRIPPDRIGSLIGVDGSVKEFIEKNCEVDLVIDSENGSVKLESKGDPSKGLRASDIIKAISHGFSPQNASKLLDDDELLFTIIDISHLGGSPKELTRIKGRIIGKDGSTRELMEEFTESNISVYGETIAVIGHPEKVRTIEGAIDMLIDGAPHGNVYSYLEKKRREEKSKSEF